MGLDAGRSPAARSSTTARWRRRKELRWATPSSKPSAANAGAEDAEARRRWRECAAEVGEVDVEVVRRWGDSGVGPSRKRDLRRDNCGFGGQGGSRAGRRGGGEGIGARRGRKGRPLQDLVADTARLPVPARRRKKIRLAGLGGLPLFAAGYIYAAGTKGGKLLR